MNIFWILLILALALHAYRQHWAGKTLQPIYVGELDARMYQAGDTYIAGGEQHVGVAEFQSLIANDCVDIAQPNAAITGGITDWLRIHALASSQSVPVSPWNLQQIHIHLAAGLPNVQWIEYFMADNALLEFQGKLIVGSALAEVVEVG